MATVTPEPQLPRRRFSRRIVTTVDLVPRNVNSDYQNREIPNHVRTELFADAKELDALTGQNFSAIGFGKTPAGASEHAS